MAQALQSLIEDSLGDPFPDVSSEAIQSRAMDDGTRPEQPAGPDQPPAEQAGPLPLDPETQTNIDDKTEVSFKLSIPSDTSVRGTSPTSAVPSATPKNESTPVVMSPALIADKGQEDDDGLPEKKYAASKFLTEAKNPRLRATLLMQNQDRMDEYVAITDPDDLAEGDAQRIEFVRIAGLPIIPEVVWSIDDDKMLQLRQTQKDLKRYVGESNLKRARTKDNKPMWSGFRTVNTNTNPGEAYVYHCLQEYAKRHAISAWMDVKFCLRFWDKQVKHEKSARLAAELEQLEGTHLRTQTEQDLIATHEAGRVADRADAKKSEQFRLKDAALAQELHATEEQIAMDHDLARGLAQEEVTQPSAPSDPQLLSQEQPGVHIQTDQVGHKTTDTGHGDTQGLGSALPSDKAPATPEIPLSQRHVGADADKCPNIHIHTPAPSAHVDGASELALSVSGSPAPSTIGHASSAVSGGWQNIRFKDDREDNQVFKARALMSKLISLMPDNVMEATGLHDIRTDFMKGIFSSAASSFGSGAATPDESCREPNWIAANRLAEEENWEAHIPEFDMNKLRAAKTNDEVAQALKTPAMLKPIQDKLEEAARDAALIGATGDRTKQGEMIDKRREEQRKQAALMEERHQESLSRLDEMLGESSVLSPPLTDKTRRHSSSITPPLDDLEIERVTAKLETMGVDVANIPREGRVAHLRELSKEISAHERSRKLARGLTTRSRSTSARQLSKTIQEQQASINRLRAEVRESSRGPKASHPQGTTHRALDLAKREWQSKIPGLATALHPEGAKQVIAPPPEMEGDGGESLYAAD